MNPRRRRCAVVDDSQLVLDVVRAVLDRAGWEVSTHAEVSGLELQLHRSRPHVILLDVEMPNVSERDLRQRITRLRAATEAKVLLHSSKQPAALAVLAEFAGADGVLAKSGDFEALCAALDQHVPP